MNSTISVIMAVYNAEATLREAVDSILAQTYTDWQFIICDDASTDGSWKILQEYAKTDNRFLLIRNENNSKLSYSLNHCLKYVTGGYIARMDADDLSTPDRFEKQVAFLKEHPEYDLVGAAMKQFNEDGFIGVVRKPEYVNKYNMRNGVTFNHATIMTYPRVYEALKGYTVSERTIRAQDSDLWFRFWSAGFSGYNMQEPLYMVREDINAIKRRTFKVRWNALKTKRMGFKMLGFPRHWLIKPYAQEIAKSLVPYSVVYKFREHQKNRIQKE